MTGWAWDERKPYAMNAEPVNVLATLEALGVRWRWSKGDQGDEPVLLDSELVPPNIRADWAIWYPEITKLLRRTQERPG